MFNLHALFLVLQEIGKAVPREYTLKHAYRDKRVRTSFLRQSRSSADGSSTLASGVRAGGGVSENEARLTRSFEAIYSHEINFHEINSHVVNSYKINLIRNQQLSDQL